MSELFEKIHALNGAAACRKSAKIQVAERAYSTARAAWREVEAAERETIARYGDGLASIKDVHAAEAKTTAESAKVSEAAKALKAARDDYAEAHLKALGPTAEAISDIVTTLSAAVDAIRNHAAGIERWSFDNGLPVPRAIRHAAGLGDVDRRLRFID